MNAGDLGTFFGCAADLMDAAGGKGGDEVRKLAGRLAPFGRLTLDQFGDFLEKAYAYSRGELDLARLYPEKKPAGNGGRSTEPKPLPPQKKPAEITEAITALKTLFDRALDPGFSLEAVEQTLTRANALSKDDLLHVTHGCGLKQRFATKPKAIDALRSWIEGRKGSHARASA